MRIVPRLGIVTIGQSPRTDLVPEMMRHLPGVEPVERGALDGMSPERIAALAPKSSGARVLTSRLADGRAVVLDHGAVPGLVQDAVHHLEDTGVDATLVVCTGSFPPLEHARPLLTADALFVGGVSSVLGKRGGTLGVLSPLDEQCGAAADKWARVAERVVSQAATPYSSDPAVAVASVARAAAKLAAAGAEAVVLDCMGYTEEMRAASREAAGVPVLLARSVVARLTAEVVCA